MIEWLAGRHAGFRAGLAVAAGGLAALGFQPYGWWPLTPLGVAVLTLAILAAGRVRGAAGLGYAWGIGFLLVGVGWMEAIFLQAMIALVVAFAGFYAVLGGLVKVAAGTRWWPLLAAAVWTGVEFSFARFPFNGFGWMRLGYAMVDSPLAGALPLIGVAGLGFLTALLAQGTVWLAVSPSRARVQLAVAGAAAISLVAAGGALVGVGTASGTVDVGWVQGGAPGGGVYGLGEPRTITRNHLAEASRLRDRIDAGRLPEPDFVVLPENTTDADPYADAETGRLVAAMSDRLGVPMLFGVIMSGPGVDERQTVSLWWEPGEGEVARYTKRGIVPFGEWVPLRSLLLPLIPELTYVGDQSIPGTVPGVIPVSLPGRALNLGVLICYDLVYDDFAADLVTGGGQLVLVQSSNAMYQGTGQIEQQFAITRARARELRREILVVTTSGVSGLIDADGRVVFTAPESVAASGVVSLTERSGRTPATWLASPLELAITLAALAGLVVAARYGRMRPEHPLPGEENG